MTQNQIGNVPTHPPAPPTQPGPLGLPQRRSNWPLVIGIIAIILGAGGILLGIYGALSPFYMEWATSMVPDYQRASMEAMQSKLIWTVIISIVTAGIALLLLVGGVQLVQRRKLAAKICLGWAILRILVVVANSVITYSLQQVQFEAMQQDPNMPEMPFGFFGAIGAVTIVIMIIWGWALPVFMLIWFSRKKIKAEVRGWA